MQVLRYFHPQSSISRILDSRGLVGGPLLTFWRKPRCRKYPLPRTSRYCRRRRILAAPLSSRLSTPFLCCLTQAEIHEKCHRSPIVSAVRVCRLGYSPGAKLEKAQ